MKSSFSEYTLGEVISSVIDRRGVTPKKLGGDWSDHGFRAISAKNIKNGRLVEEDHIRLVSAEMYRRWMPVEVSKNDILITSEAPFGETLLWDSNEKIVASQRIFVLKIKPEFDPNYIFYYMSSSPFKAELEARSTGTTVTGLRQPELLKCKVFCPDLETQRKIGALLRSIDKKIDLNNRVNGCLLEQVFSKYDALFGDDDSFKASTVSSIGTVVGGGTPSKSKPEFYCEHGIPWVTPKDLSLDHSVFIERGNEDISELGLAKSGATIMPANTVLFSSRAPIGYTAISLGPISTNQGFKSVIPHPEIGPYFVYCFLKKNLETIEGMASGSTFKEVSGSIMKRVPVNVPNARSLRLFNEFAAPAFNTIKNNEAEIRRLTILRDSLLPKLMSGEIDVDTVEIG